MRTLSIDDIGVARLATDHLISLGHRVIAHIGGNSASEMDFHVPTKRRVGYEAGARPRRASRVDQSLFQAADFTIQGGYAAAKQLLGDPRSRPTAVFVASDEMAIGTILAARDLGLSVPDDISVIGVDDHELSEFFGLSTIAQFPALQGRMAVDIVMDQLHPGHRDLELVNTPLPFELIVRSSTSRPAQASRTRRSLSLPGAPVDQWLGPPRAPAATGFAGPAPPNLVKVLCRHPTPSGAVGR